MSDTELYTCSDCGESCEKLYSVEVTAGGETVSYVHLCYDCAHDPCPLCGRQDEHTHSID